MSQSHLRFGWTGEVDVPCFLGDMMDSSPRTGSFWDWRVVGVAEVKNAGVEEEEEERNAVVGEKVVVDARMMDNALVNLVMVS